MSQTIEEIREKIKGLEATLPEKDLNVLYQHTIWKLNDSLKELHKQKQEILDLQNEYVDKIMKLENKTSLRIDASCVSMTTRRQPET